MKRLVLACALLAAPVVAVSPVEASKPWLCPQYTAQIKQTFPRKHWRTMDAIMHRESRCSQRATGWNHHKGMSHRDCTDNGTFKQRQRCKAVKSWDMGLFQINSSWSTLTTQVCGKNTRSTVLWKVECNFAVAGVLYKNGGLAHWRGTSGK